MYSLVKELNASAFKVSINVNCECQCEAGSLQESKLWTLLIFPFRLISVWRSIIVIAAEFILHRFDHGYKWDSSHMFTKQVIHM